MSFDHTITRIRAFSEPHTDTVGIILGNNAHGQTWFGTPITFSKYDVGSVAPPALRLSPDMAQLLMDELWGVGIRPTEGRGSAGSLAATERHLEDMRKLNDKLLGRVLAEPL